MRYCVLHQQLPNESMTLVRDNVNKDYVYSQISFLRMCGATVSGDVVCDGSLSADLEDENWLFLPLGTEE